ncbi:MAG: HD domain-containing protein [Flavobacteriales bacterium]
MDFQGAIEHILNRLAEDLPSHLSYHGHHHTLDVLEASERIARAEGVSEEDINLLLVAAAYHDCGFLYGHENHEQKGCDVVKSTLPQYGFEQSHIDLICQMIMATKVPQSPSCLLCNILCDADLDYLGRDDFEPVADSLFQELKVSNIVSDIETWNKIQLSFLSQHTYHTDYGKTQRQPQKSIHLEKIRTIVDGYEQ